MGHKQDDESKGKVIPFSPPKSRKKVAKSRPAEKVSDVKGILKLKEISDTIDAILLKALTEDQIHPNELVGLMAHRLGSLMRHIDDKDKLWSICEQVLKRQASIE